MPLSERYCKQRRQHLIAQTNADMIIISNPQHLLYFCGYWNTPLHIGTWGTPHLLINLVDGHTTLVTHDFAPNTESAYVDDIQKWHWYNAATDPAPPLFPTMVSALQQHLIPYNNRHLAIETGWLPHGVTTAQTTDITTKILTMRRNKYPDELDMIRACITAIEAGHRAARQTIQPGITEIDVYNAIYAAIVAEAGEPLLPLGDYASGERAHQGGGPPTNRILQPGEVMIIDVFPVIGGYRADFTATYATTGPLNPAQKKLETALHHALAAGENLLKPGVRAGDVYDAIKAELAEHDYADAFPHHAGHGIGLGHPEAPFLVPQSDEVLQVGDVITLEPGAYGAGFGGRIEHNYHIIPDGFERLTHHNTHMLKS